MENLQIRGLEIPVVLQRANRKTMEVTLKEGKLNVKAPKDMPIQEITEILESESANIMRKLTEVRYPNNILNVKGISTPVKLIRSDRKMITVEVQHSEVIVRAPYDAPEEKVMKFLLFKAKDIEEAYQQNKASAPERLTKEELLSLFKKAEEYIPQRVQYYAPLIGVIPSNITIRNQKTRWGSCSDKGNLNFNCLLMLAPVEVIDSVVVHELCHLKYMNHSQDFYEEIYRVYPEYDKWNQWLKENGAAIVRRMTG